MNIDERTVWWGYSEQKTPQTHILKTPEEWKAFNEAFGGHLPPALPENVMAVAVFSGEKGTDGHRINIFAPVEKNGKTEIGWIEIAPQAAAAIVTFPVAIRFFPSTDNEVEVKKWTPQDIGAFLKDHPEERDFIAAYRESRPSIFLSAAAQTAPPMSVKTKPLTP